MKQKRKWNPLAKLVLMIAAELLAVAAVIWIADPFYQYHEPLGNMEAVLNDRDNQMPGTVRNFTYDSVLVGSSVAENFDSSYLDARYGCKTLKVIKASGSMADLLYYLQMVHENRELKQVFWCLDLFALDADTEVTLYGGDIPRYLHTPTIWDDTEYLLNKEVLFMKLPYMVAAAMTGKNTGGHAYDWSDGKEFGAAKAMQAYQKPAQGLEVQDFTAQKPVIAQNLEALTAEIAAHPEIQFTFLMPPYSMMWWDCAQVNGLLEEEFYILEQLFPAILSYENVELYYFQSEKEIVCNLDLYMDMVHYAPQVNQLMLEKMVSGENRVTADNWPEVITKMRELVCQICEKEIYNYYE